MIGIGSRRERLRSGVASQPSAVAFSCVMAFSAYLAGLGGIGLMALGDQLRSWESAAASMTLQIPADASAARVGTVLALLRQSRGLGGVRLLEPAETARLVEPWLGSSAAADGLPVPRIIDMSIDGSGAPDLSDLRRKLASILPDARLEDHALLFAERRAAAIRLGVAIMALLIIALAIAVLSAIANARSGLLLHCEQVRLLHSLGATDAYIARQFELQAFWSGGAGGATGAAAAALTLLALGGDLPALPLPAWGGGDWRVWLILLGAGVAAGGIAVAAARLAVLRHLAQMP